jgi:peptidoglycan hydrolase-like protein with peptidoglycan-binding domain
MHDDWRHERDVSRVYSPRTRSVMRSACYTGTVDGVVGSGTVEPVKKFQRVNGMTVNDLITPAPISEMQAVRNRWARLRCQ